MMKRRPPWIRNGPSLSTFLNSTTFNTVLFAILDQSTCLWALLVAKLKGIPNNPSNKTLG